MTTLSFVEVVDIKRYSEDFLILNICKFSITSDLNYVRLVIPTMNLDIDIFEKLMELGFMWFAKDHKLPEDIAYEFHSMVVKEGFSPKMWIEQRSSNKSNNIGRSPNAYAKVSHCYAYFFKFQGKETH